MLPAEAYQQWPPGEGDAYQQMQANTSYASLSSAVLLEDKRVLHELSESMVDQLNKMYSFFQQVMTHERSRHSSEISLLMRKVDKDLKETFRSVKETFKTLTEQVTMLAKEVEKGRKQVKSLTDKYTQAKKLAQTRGQYVSELEAVVDSHGPKVSEELKRLTEGQAELREEMQKSEMRFKAREKQLMEENKALKAAATLLESQAKEIKKSVPPPLLPEMASSWTYKQDSSGPNSLGNTGPIAPKESLAKWDSQRAVPRTKAVQGGRRMVGPASPRSPMKTMKVDPEVAELRRRLEHADERAMRQAKLTAFSSASLLLLKEIFGELNTSGQLKAGGRKDGEAQAVTKKAPDVLESIVKMFYEAIPRLGNLSELFSALNEEMALAQAPSQSPTVTTSVMQ